MNEKTRVDRLVCNSVYCVDLINKVTRRPSTRLGWDAFEKYKDEQVRADERLIYKNRSLSKIRYKVSGQVRKLVAYKFFFFLFAQLADDLTTPLESALAFFFDVANTRLVSSTAAQ